MATPFERRIDRPTVCRDSPSIRNPRCYPVWPKGTCQDVRNYSGQIGHVDLRRDVWGVGDKARVQGLRPLLDRADVARIRNLKLLSQIAINALLAHYPTKPLAKLAEPREPSLLAYREPAEVERTAHFAVLQNQLFGVHRRLHEGSAK